MGPRALGAMEALAARLSETDRPLAVDCFDPFPAHGAGPNFDPDEPSVCQLNIPTRDIEISEPHFSNCGSFSEWCKGKPDPDAFPTRADMGRYLEARYADVVSSGQLRVTHHRFHVTHLTQQEDGWMLRTAHASHGAYAEVLLSLGQPAVTPDDQLAEWQAHSEAANAVLAQAYPAKNLSSSAANWTDKTVAIRGLALSVFDVLRVLTTLRGGRFERGAYIPSGQEPARILPFSLDGKPPFPKPQTQQIDARFNPTAAETATFAANIASAATTTPEAAQDLITKALVPVISRVLSEGASDASAGEVSDWLEVEWTASGSQERAGPMETLRAGIAMAEGSCVPSIGYVVGQVWRKWQNTLRCGYNPADTPPDTAEKIVAFDEGLKRYSYGPPVSSSRELLALIGAGIVDLDYAVDPDIGLTDGGWRLKADAGSIEAEVMIDAVMAPPDPTIVHADLVQALVEEGRICPISDGLAAHTASDGQLIGKDGKTSAGLCLLGRLALGSVVAADSLHDCFGEASQRWAQGVVTRLGEG